MMLTIAKQEQKTGLLTLRHYIATLEMLEGYHLSLMKEQTPLFLCYRLPIQIEISRVWIFTCSCWHTECGCVVGFVCILGSMAGCWYAIALHWLA